MQGLRPTDIDSFLTNGFLVIENFLPKETCNSLMQRMQKIIEENKKSIPTLAFSAKDNAHANDDYFIQSADKIHFFLEPEAFNEENRLIKPIEHCINKVGHGLHVADPLFNSIAADTRIRQYCLQLGFKKVGLLQSMYIFKQPTIGDAVQWHQDSCYLYVEGSDVIGFWLALEDATRENGCLQVIPSPCTYPLKQRMVYHNQRSDFIELEPNLTWAEKYKQYVEVPQGSLVMLHGRLPHASGANHSDKSRHAFALHVIDATKPYPKDNWLQWPTEMPVL